MNEGGRKRSEDVDFEGKAFPKTEASAQLLIAVERLAMLHYHYASTLVDELGEERGRELILKAIAAYGREIGERQRRRVIKIGLEPSCENYKAVPDLPTLAWTPEHMPRLRIGDREVPVCLLAKYWLDRDAASLGRLYCYVDQAKYAAFDPDCECRHPHNVLEGDDQCEIVARKRAEWENEG